MTTIRDPNDSTPGAVHLAQRWYDTSGPVVIVDWKADPLPLWRRIARAWRAACAAFQG